MSDELDAEARVLNRLRSDGQTLHLITCELTRSGVPTKTGKSNRWTHQAVARILRRTDVVLADHK